MILVTVGTNEAPFDRLVRALDAIPPGEPVFVQRGASRVEPARAEWVDFLPFDELAARVRGARVVVTHAGIGSILVALANGRRPVVVPRLHRFGEAVDDHQVPIARRLHDAGLVTLVEQPEALAGALAAGAESGAVEAGGQDGRLVADLREHLAALVGRRP